MNEKGLGWLIEQKLAKRLNVVFDIDHTLIFACNFDPRQSTLKPGSTHDTRLLKLNCGPDYTLVIRQYVPEMLAFLSQFCTFYAYSHGLREYVLKILDQLDPE